MTPIEELLASSDISSLRARRRQLTAYRDKLAKQPYTQDDRMYIAVDISLINDRLKELGE